MGYESPGCSASRSEAEKTQRLEEALMGLIRH